MSEPGFVIDGEHYPFPDNYTLGDTMLIGRFTGKGMYEFAEAIFDGTQDPAIITAYAAVAFWKKHPRWKLEKVEQHIMSVQFDAFGVETGEPSSDTDPQKGNGEKPESTDSPDNAAA